MTTEPVTLRMVKLKDDTHQELVKIGKYGETMDDIVKKCVKAYKQVHKDD
jgi:hypothetical protein